MMKDDWTPGCDVKADVPDDQKGRHYDVFEEIDLVAEEGGDLVFVEVKTRRGVSHGLPEEGVTPRKQRKLVQLAFHHLVTHDYPDRSWRIDVVAVQLSSSGRLE